MLGQEAVERYNLLFKEFERFLTRPLTMKEKTFLKWMATHDIEMEYFRKQTSITSSS
ncbi:hypothetical protein [Fictibacillus macauensis]|uniref:hypothetical protein n=1 Tax=Fictibacillus macauensis TaxID=245160 RepID=UPI0002E6E1A0|nr:hypothetical protein [Fictibacillus macauensis]